MSVMVLESPSILRLPGPFNEDSLRKALTFKSKTAAYELSKFKKNRWFSQTHGEEAYQLKLDELKAAVNVCLLKEDEGGFYTYPGLRAHLAQTFGWEFQNDVEYPEPGLLAYEHKPEYEPRYYQTDGVEALLTTKHAAVEIGTGLGKSVMAEMLCKRLAQKTLVMAPTKSIAGQLYKQLHRSFGGKKVGFFGDGKKVSKKLITVGIAASLTKVEPGSEDWDNLRACQVFIPDESHLCPADSLEKVCSGVAANAPYRFFFSGTQLRGDGADLLLEGITGPIVYEMSVERGVREGFLAKPNFFMHRLNSPSTYQHPDHMRMMGPHWYKNADLGAYAADLANKSVSLLGHSVLILVEHVEQFQYLLSHLRHEVSFAHGGLNADNKKYVDPRFHKSDVDDLVKRFNAGELPILVGTSCVRVGTDFTGVKTVINLCGGKSEVSIRQAVGRGTRLAPNKDSFNYHDFFVKFPGTEDIVNSIERHALERRKILDSIYGPVRWVG
jgi:superfamily II DNA or RNA helicase